MIIPDIDPVSQVVLATFPATFSITMPTNTADPAAWTGVPGATSPYTDPGTAPDNAFRLVE